MIKLDTQGSEIDILKGGKNLVNRSSVIILEVSFIEYNEGAPLAEEVLSFMNEIGFDKYIVVGEHYIDDKVVQKDLCFYKSN